MSALKASEGTLIGDSVILPSIIQMDRCSLGLSSSDIPYFQLWKEKWKTLDFDNLKDIQYKN